MFRVAPLASSISPLMERQGVPDFSSRSSKRHCREVFRCPERDRPVSTVEVSEIAKSIPALTEKVTRNAKLVAAYDEDCRKIAIQNKALRQTTREHAWVQHKLDKEHEMAGIRRRREFRNASSRRSRREVACARDPAGPIQAACRACAEKGS